MVKSWWIIMVYKILNRKHGRINLSHNLIAHLITNGMLDLGFVLKQLTYGWIRPYLSILNHSWWDLAFCASWCFLMILNRLIVLVVTVFAIFLLLLLLVVLLALQNLARVGAQPEQWLRIRSKAYWCECDFGVKFPGMLLTMPRHEQKNPTVGKWRRITNITIILSINGSSQGMAKIMGCKHFTINHSSKHLLRN